VKSMAKLKIRRKVYCEECIYLSSTDDCNHPNNLGDDWYGKKHENLDRPCDLNESNRCGWFKGPMER